MTAAEWLAENDGLIRKLARTLTPPSPYDRDDLCQAGRLGAVRAFSNYKPGSAATLTTWCGNAARYAMIDWIRANSWGYKRHQGWQATQISLSLATGQDSTLADQLEAGPDRYLRLEAEDRDRILASLPPRLRFVCESVERGDTLQQIGDVLGVTESRCSQLLRDAQYRILAVQRAA